MLHSVYLSARLSLPVTLVTFELTIFRLFFTPLLLLNYFLFNLFLFLQKSGGALAPPAPPSARSLLQGMLQQANLNKGVANNTVSSTFCKNINLKHANM